MKEYVRNVGLDIEFIHGELKKLSNSKSKINFLSRMVRKAWRVLYSLDELTLELEKLIIESKKKKNLDKPKRSKKINLNAFNFINKKIAETQHQRSKTLLNDIVSLTIGKSFEGAAIVLDSCVNEVGAYIDDLNKLIQKNEFHLLDEIKDEDETEEEKVPQLERINWLDEDEDPLIELFRMLISGGFIKEVEDLNNYLAVHFNVLNKKKLKVKKIKGVESFIWKESIIDLAKLYSELTRRKLIDFRKNKYKNFILHFLWIDKEKIKEIKEGAFASTVSKVNNRNLAYEPSESIEQITNRLPDRR